MFWWKLVFSNFDIFINISISDFYNWEKYFSLIKMWLQKTIVFIVAFAAVIGISFWFKKNNEIAGNSHHKENVYFSNEKHNYVIVKTLETQISNTELTSKNISKLNQKTQNYKCSFKDQNNFEVNDTLCRLFNINDSEDPHDHSVDLEKINKSNDPLLLKDLPKKTRWYILKLNANKYSKINRLNKKIQVYINDSESKKVALFQEEYLINRFFDKFQTDMVLVRKEEEDEQLPILSNKKDFYACKTDIESKERKICDVFSFNEEPIKKNGEVDFNIENIENISKRKNKNDQYFLLRFRGSEKFDTHKTEIELRTKNPVLTINTKKDLNTRYVNAYIGYLDQENPKKSKLWKIKPSTEELLVYFDNISSDEITNNELEENGKKNYVCKFDSNVVDKSCLLVSIFQNNGSLANLTKFINSNNRVISKRSLTKTGFFKLIIQNTWAINNEFGDSNIINIESTGNEDLNKKYGRLRVMAKNLNEFFYGKTNLFLARSKSKGFSDSYQDIKCKLKHDKKTESCKVYKVEEKLSDEKLNNFSLEKIKEEISSNADTEKKKIVLIKFTETLKNQKNLKSLSNEISIYKSSGEKINSYEIIAPIMTTSEDYLSSNNSIILQ